MSVDNFVQGFLHMPQQPSLEQIVIVFGVTFLLIIWFVIEES
jgi:hypothetical protein